MADVGLLDALILALVQGITEWLPVSSSGHLVIAQHLLGVPDIPVAFDLLLHLGTLAAVLLAYRLRVAAMAEAVWTWPRDARTAGWGGAFRGHTDRKLAVFVVVATIPAAVLGILLEPYIEASFASLTIVAIGLTLAALLMLSTTWAKPRPQAELRLTDAIVIGLAQACSLFRGLSRSGTTISAALWRGVDRRQAADFSFLMSIPVFAGATIVQAEEMARLPELGWAQLAIGFLVSFGVGFATLRLLVGFVARRGVRPFAYYCLAAAAFTAWLAWAA